MREFRKSEQLYVNCNRKVGKLFVRSDPGVTKMRRTSRDFFYTVEILMKQEFTNALILRNKEEGWRKVRKKCTNMYDKGNKVYQCLITLSKLLFCTLHFYKVETGWEKNRREFEIARKKREKGREDARGRDISRSNLYLWLLLPSWWWRTGVTRDLLALRPGGKEKKETKKTKRVPPVGGTNAEWKIMRDKQ